MSLGLVNSNQDRGKFLIACLAVVTLPLGLIQQGLGADQIVTSLASSGPGSLRQAVVDVGAGEVIRFDAALSGGVIRLEGSPLVISKPLTSDGTLPDRVVQLDAELLSRIFEISNFAGVVTLRGLALYRGRAPAGLNGSSAGAAGGSGLRVFFWSG